MRIYYCDTLGAAPAPSWLSKDQRTMDIDVLCQWLLDATPRSRLDALPFLHLTKDALRRFLTRDIVLVSERQQQAQALLLECQSQLETTRQQLAESEARNTRLMGEISNLASKAQQLEKVQHELQQARQLNESMQAKILKLAAAAEMHPALLAGKLEEVKKATRLGVEALWENRLQMMNRMLALKQEQVDKTTGTQFTCFTKQFTSFTKQGVRGRMSSTPRQHTSAYVGLRQHTSAYVSTHLCTWGILASRIVQILTQKATESHKRTTKELEEAEAKILRLEVLSMCPHTAVYESAYYLLCVSSYYNYTCVLILEEADAKRYCRSFASRYSVCLRYVYKSTNTN
jgi:hypothetical protein